KYPGSRSRHIEPHVLRNERVTAMFPWNLFPFNEDTKKMLQNLQPGEIEKYVHDLFNKLFQQQMGDFRKAPSLSPFGTSTGQTSETKLDITVFETHDFIFVRIPVQEKWISRIRLFHTSTQLIIEHIPEIDDKHHVALPAAVKKKGTTAQVKDGV